jgi:hypothetical protein
MLVVCENNRGVIYIYYGRTNVVRSDRSVMIERMRELIHPTCAPRRLKLVRVSIGLERTYRCRGEREVNIVFFVQEDDGKE